MILKSSFEEGSTLVENSFIDEYMAKANGEYVKVYFLLLRRLNSSYKNLSISDLADSLDLTERDILRALKYWAQEGLLLLQYDQNGEIISLEIGRFSKSDSNATLRPTSSNITTITSFPSPQKRQEQKKLDHQQELKQLAFVAEQYLGKHITKTDIETINFFYDDLHFSTDLIEYLIEYCAEHGHKNWSYIKTVAIAWGDANITTVEAAKKRTMLFSDRTTNIFKAFGLNSRAAIQSELDYIRTWCDDYCFSLDIIQEACRRTVMATGSANWAYADKILQNWLQKDVTKMQDIEALDAHHKSISAKRPKKKATTKNNFDNFDSRSYDMGELEKQLLD